MVSTAVMRRMTMAMSILLLQRGTQIPELSMFHLLTAPVALFPGGPSCLRIRQKSSNSIYPCRKTDDRLMAKEWMKTGMFTAVQIFLDNFIYAVLPDLLYKDLQVIFPVFSPSSFRQAVPRGFLLPCGSSGVLYKTDAYLQNHGPCC